MRDILAAHAVSLLFTALPAAVRAADNGEPAAQLTALYSYPALWTLLATVCLIWYVAIWSICLLGLSNARAYFLPPIPRSPLSPVRPSALTTNASATGQPTTQPQPPPTSDHVPGVSVLRPLSGLDCNLFSNLSSTFKQDYPVDRFEVLLSIKDLESDEAQKVYKVAQMVQQKYPHVRSQIIVGDEVAGVNPKINNLVRPYSQAKYDIIWVVDSQVWMPDGAMARAVDSLTLTRQPKPVPAFLNRSPHGSRVGLVHHVPLAVLPGSSWGSQVERVFLSTTHAKMYLAINSLSIDSCVMGKSNMYRKSDLERVPDSFFEVSDRGSRGEAGAIGSSAFAATSTAGAHANSNNISHDDDYVVVSDREAQTQTQPLLDSDSDSSGKLNGGPIGKTVQSSARALARFGIYLAEDNMLALSLWRAPLSLSHVLARGDVAHTAVGDIRTLGDYARRRMRWIRVRKHMVLAATLLEPFTESLIAGLMGLFAVRWFVFGQVSLELVSVTSVLLFVAHLTAWYLTDLAVLKALCAGVELPQHERWTFLRAWCIREAMALPIWMWAVSGSTGEFALP